MIADAPAPRRQAHGPALSDRDARRAAEHEARLARYREGLNDHEIAAAVGTTSGTIFKWRERYALPSNTPPGRNRKATVRVVTYDDDVRRRALNLLERGVGARLIAPIFEIPLQTLERWRTAMLRERPELRRPGTARRNVPRHPNGRVYSRMLPDKRRRALELYADGRDDHQIAAVLGVKRQAVWEWRNALFLAPILAPGTTRRVAAPKKPRRRFGPAITPLSNPVHAAIIGALGSGIAPDIRDDAASELWLALAEGRITTAQIAAEAGRFRNRTIAQYASRFGPRSLDEELGDDDGFRMIDLIRDERSSSWLEEMGATAW